MSSTTHKIGLEPAKRMRRLAWIILLAPAGVLAICVFTVFVGFPFMVAWPDIKHQLTLNGLQEFSKSSGYKLSPKAELLFCEDSRGGWHGDGTLNVHLKVPRQVLDDWIEAPFKKEDWHNEFHRPRFKSNRGTGPVATQECFWAKWGDAGNWRLIVVQPSSGDVWYTEFNS